MSRCPYCSEEVHIDAFKCKHCGENIKYLSWWNVHKLKNTKQYGGWSRGFNSIIGLLCILFPPVGMPIALIAMRSNHVVKNFQGKGCLIIGLVIWVMGLLYLFVTLIEPS